MSLAMIVLTKGVEVGYFVVALYPVVALELIVKDIRLKTAIAILYCLTLASVAGWYGCKTTMLLFAFSTAIFSIKALFGQIQRDILKQQVIDIIGEEIDEALRGPSPISPLIPEDAYDNEDNLGEVMNASKQPKKHWLKKVLK